MGHVFYYATLKPVECENPLDQDPSDECGTKIQCRCIVTENIYLSPSNNELVGTHQVSFHLGLSDIRSTIEIRGENNLKLSTLTSYSRSCYGSLQGELCYPEKPMVFNSVRCSNSKRLDSPLLDAIPDTCRAQEPCTVVKAPRQELQKTVPCYAKSVRRLEFRSLV